MERTATTHALPTGNNLTALADAVLRLAHEIDPHGRRKAPYVVPLKGTEVAILRWVHRHPGVSPSDTADATGLRRSNLSAGLRTLENKGFIRRERDPDDARSLRLFITEEAERNIAALEQHWTQLLGSMLDQNAESLTEVITLLDRLATGLHGRGDVD